jgi:hypothetical protein
MKKLIVMSFVMSLMLISAVFADGIISKSVEFKKGGSQFIIGNLKTFIAFVITCNDIQNKVGFVPYYIVEKNYNQSITATVIVDNDSICDYIATYK